MNKYMGLALLSLQIFTPTTLRAQSEKDYNGTYLCISDAAGGVKFDKTSKKWVAAKFKTGERYILTTKAGGFQKNYSSELVQTYFVTWEPHGANYEPYMKACWTTSNQLRKVNPALNFALDGFIECKQMSIDLKINVETLRFLSSYTYGFVDGSDVDTPVIEIGNCTKIN